MLLGDTLYSREGGLPDPGRHATVTAYTALTLTPEKLNAREGMERNDEIGIYLTYPKQNRANQHALKLKAVHATGCLPRASARLTADEHVVVRINRGHMPMIEPLLTKVRDLN